MKLYVVIRRSKANPEKLKVTYNGTSTNKTFTVLTTAQDHCKRLNVDYPKFSYQVVELVA